MAFSSDLIDKYKSFKGYTQDKQVLSDVENLHQGNLSKIRKGERHLTANQVIFIAENMSIDVKEALLQLALEKSKSKEESKIWNEVIKKISAACAIVGLCIGLAAEPESQEAFN
ncbi:hypothetical protein [Pseudoalteromonas sp.]|uniref:hypothetical protein n=1 Tax=Pseudoalteromonas sp. TaxID=53249 RepID=UPI003567B66A